MDIVTTIIVILIETRLVFQRHEQVCYLFTHCHSIDIKQRFKHQNIYLLPDITATILSPFIDALPYEQLSDLALLGTSCISTALLALLYRHGKERQKKLHRYAVLGVFIASFILGATKRIAGDFLIFVAVPWMMITALCASRWFGTDVGEEKILDLKA